MASGEAVETLLYTPIDSTGDPRQIRLRPCRDGFTLVCVQANRSLPVAQRYYDARSHSLESLQLTVDASFETDGYRED